MKQLFTFLLALLPAALLAQIPAGYYNPANGSTGQALRAALSGIIRTHTALTYTPGLWNAYHTTDVKPNGKLWDMYSDIPSGTPAYEYTMGSDQCGNVTPTTENVCYNREHTWPQSKFGSAAPMQTDLFLVYPTDNYVNATRGDNPYGRVGTASQTFTNGSKLGNNAYPGAPGGLCFEPIDSFKGDFARTYFYISTCYRNDSAAFNTWEMATRCSLKPWAAQMLLEWHHLDPVSKKEIDRNNAVYALQGNRNPFIDRPGYADCIWGNDCSALSAPQTASAQSGFSIYPNPSATTITVEWTSPSGTGTALIKAFDMSGREIYNNNPVAGNSNLSINVTGWHKGIYFVQVITAGSVATRKLIVE